MPETNCKLAEVIKNSDLHKPHKNLFNSTTASGLCLGKNLNYNMPGLDCRLGYHNLYIKVPYKIHDSYLMKIYSRTA